MEIKPRLFYRVVKYLGRPRLLTTVLAKDFTEIQHIVSLAILLNLTTFWKTRSYDGVLEWFFYVC